MAASGLSSVLEDELSCSICLQIYTDPVLLGCQHTYCKECLLKTWQDGSCTCPECRKVFHFRTREDMQLKLAKNFKLASIVDKLSSLDVEGQKPLADGSQATAAQRSAGEPCCDFCCGPETRPAMQTCRTCDVSLCEEHLKAHSVNTQLGRHVLVSLTKTNTRKCTEHGHPITLFCLQDRTPVCAQCQLQTHRGHRVSSIDEAATQGKAELLSQIESLTSSKAPVHRKLEILRKTEENVNRTSLAFYASVDAAFDMAVASLREEKEAVKQSAGAEEIAVLNKIRTQIVAQEKNMGTAEAVSKEGRDLLRDSDAFHFLQVKGDIEKKITAAMKNPQNENIVTKSLYSSLRDVVEHLPPRIFNWKQENTMLKHFRSPILDEDTIHYQLEVDNGGTELCLVQPLKRRCDVMDNDDSFSFWRQALCEESYDCGLHYWEVDVSESGDWSVGVCYESMVRKGKSPRAALGRNSDSWCLDFTNDDDLAVFHDGEETTINIIGNGCHIHRVGVLLDWDQQRISFYDVSPARVHLHTFQAQIDAPLLPAFRVAEGTVTICTSPLVCPLMLG